MDMKKKGLMLVFFTAVISGISIFINSFGVSGFDSSVFTFSKNIVVALLLFSVIIGVKEFFALRNLNKKQWSKLATIGLIGGSIPFLLFFKGLQMTTGSTSGFIHKTLFVFVAVFALFFLKEKLSKGFIFGAVLLLLGAFLMMSPDLVFSSGHILVLGATILWGVENVISKNALKELSGNIVAFGRMFFGSLFIFTFLLFTGKTPMLFSMTNAQYMWIAVTSVFLLLFVFTYYNGLKYVKVSTAASVLAIGAPITTALSIIFKGTVVTAMQAAGMLSIVLGVVVIVWGASIYSTVVNYVSEV